MTLASTGARAASRSAPRYLVESVGRACDILATFRRPEEVLHLREITKRTGQKKATVFRLLMTLVSKDLLERVGEHGYRPRFEPLPHRKYRIGYAAQSQVRVFISTVNEGIISAARQAGVDLVVLNNKASRVTAVRNAAQFIQEKVDLVIEFQLHTAIADTLSSKYASAGIPVITVDAPQPGAVYFGPDNYKVGHMGGIYLGKWAMTNWQGRVDQIVCIAPHGGFLHARMLGILEGLRDTLPHFDSASVFRYEKRPNYENSRMLIRQHLRRHGAQHVLVGAVNDQSGLGALQAFHDFGCEEKCAIVGQGGALEARQEMRSPGTRFIGSIAYFPETYGGKIIRLALDILENRSVPRVALIHHKMVNPQNVDKMYPDDLQIPVAT